MSVRRIALIASLSFVAAAAATPAFALSQRTFVASYGVDGGNLSCSLANPCRSFNVAIGNTNPGGELVILDTAGYGPMTINKAIRIIGPSGVYGGISSITPGTDGITINAGDNDIVTLRGLDVAGLGGLYGINVVNAGGVHIQSTSVGGFFQAGGACIRLNTTRFIGLAIVDSFLRDCSTGLLVNSNSTNRVLIDVENTLVENMAAAGLSLSGSYAVNLRSSSVVGANIGVLTSDTIDNTFSRLNVDDSLFTSNFGGAIKTTGSGSAAPIFAVANSRFHQNFAVVLHGFGTVSLDRNTVITGSNSFVNCGSGSIVSAGNNTINLMGDTSLPTGCSSFVTSFSIIAPK